ncbi:uncharacterized protein LOC121427290 [Lytechinus variegatus]|uniref:uncharacterized protein LOC121427290 n=1 Tax=Lytechinus variegatus TaxID=7654 RepID=UPI001BB15138|nr:uncharacterized protein LOC121427290 [Lytechinus variegatus]
MTDLIRSGEIPTITPRLSTPFESWCKFTTFTIKCAAIKAEHVVENRQRLSEFYTWRHIGRSLKATDWESCQFGETLERYDEPCPNGATNILLCNPGQLKIAECIGQDGDTSRICDPCPQKFYQSYYNRCTACHPCSECGANERIKEKCTDETDTICENIIPPEPVPTFPATVAPLTYPPTPSSTQSPTNAPRITTAVAENKTTRGVTYGIVDTTEVVPTSQAGIEKPPQSSSNDNTEYRTIAITVCVILAVLVVALTTLCCFIFKQRRKIKELKAQLRTHTCNEIADARNGIPMKTLDSGLPSSHADLDSEPGATPAEYVNLNGACGEELDAPGTSGASENIYQVELGQGEYVNSESQRTGLDDPPKERFLVQRHADTDSETGSTPNWSERQEAAQEGAQSNVTGSVGSLGLDGISTPGSRYLSSSDLAKDGEGSGDPEEQGSNDRLHDRGTDTEVPGVIEGCSRTVQAVVHTPAGIGASAAHLGKDLRGRPPPKDKNFNGIQQKSFEASSASGASGVGDSDGSVTGPESEHSPDRPKTLRSGAPRDKVGGLPEADPLRQQPTGPEMGTNKKAKRKIISNFLKGRKRTKMEEYAPVPQEDLSSNSDKMVSEKFLDDLADHIDLKTLDKLCRELGVEAKDVSNMKITHQLEHGRELAFKMFMDIRSTKGQSFTYRCTIRAMRQSKNGHLVEEFIKKYNLR